MDIPFIDTFKLSEDDRIKFIGGQILDGERVGVLVDVEGVEGLDKADRYIRKLKRFCAPVNLEYKISDGPVKNVKMIAVWRKQ